MILCGADLILGRTGRLRRAGLLEVQQPRGGALDVPDDSVNKQARTASVAAVVALQRDSSGELAQLVDEAGSGSAGVAAEVAAVAALQRYGSGELPQLTSSGGVDSGVGGRRDRPQREYRAGGRRSGRWRGVSASGGSGWRGRASGGGGGAVRAARDNMPRAR